MKTLVTLALFVAVLAPCHAMAAIVDSSSNGFTVLLTLNVQAAPDDVYRKLVRNIGRLCCPSHASSNDAHNLSIEEKPGGCWCEKLAGGGGVVHMELIHFVPGKMLLFKGTLGPLQFVAATGAMKFQFSPFEGGTKLEVVYTVVGYQPAGMSTWAAPL